MLINQHLRCIPRKTKYCIRGVERSEPLARSVKRCANRVRIVSFTCDVSLYAVHQQPLNQRSIEIFRAASRTARDTARETAPEQSCGATVVSEVDASFRWACNPHPVTLRAPELVSEADRCESGSEDHSIITHAHARSPLPNQS